MTPHAYAPQSDNESLQADVMRFMAIIAFCLIAILALVRHAEPAVDTAPAAVQESAAVKEPAAAKEPAAEAAPTEVAAKVPEPPVTAPEPPEIPRSLSTTESWRQPLPKAEPVPTRAPQTPKPEPKPQRLEAQDVAAQTSRARPAQPATAETASAAKPAAAAKPADEEGLSLRFASDGDFLRLIARGDIRVYAFRDADVLTLTSAYDFLKARSPGQLYELMRETIPSVIVDALVRSRRERADSDSFSWGITLPAAIQQQISTYLARAASGQLVIDRYGDVHHVANR